MDETRETTDRVTWATLLARWTEFARSAVALPSEGEAGRYRSAVAPAIGLQAVTHALAEADRLSQDERAVALDKAELGIRAHAAALNEIWRGERLPPEVGALVSDARGAHDAARGAGLEWCALETMALEHPAAFALGLAAAGFAGDLLLPTPGVPMFAGAPVAFARAPAGGAPEPEIVAAIGGLLAGFGEADGPARVRCARQVYRQFDFAAGGPVRDLVRAIDLDLPPGQPLLVPVIEAGEIRPVTPPPRGPQIDQALPVVFGDEPSSLA